MRNNELRRMVTPFLALLISSALAPTAFAQSDDTTSSNAYPNATFSAPSILSISLPPNARLRLDVDARDEDILGMVKSLLRGFNGQSLKSLMDSAKAPSTPPVDNDADAPPPPSTPPAKSSAEIDKATIKMLSDADLGTLLQNINHLRVVAFELPNSQRGYSGSKSTPARNQAVISYYEQKYVGLEGGRRVARADFDEMQMLMVGFPNRGFAVVLQAPGMGFVMRSDGYPNFESVGPIAMSAFLQMAPLMR